MRIKICILITLVFLNCTYTDGYSVGRINYISRDEFCNIDVVGLSIGSQEQKAFNKEATIYSPETKQKLFLAYEKNALIRFKYNSDKKWCGPFLNIIGVIETK